MVKRVAALMLSGAMLWLGASGSAGAQSTRPEIRVRLQFSPPGSLDPVNNTRAADYFVYWNIFDHLVRWKPGSTDLEPDLAERWDISQDGRVWTFFLRKGVQFHKGYGELTSEDVKFTFDRFQDKALASPNAGDWANVEKIETPDRYTVRITLRDPSATFLADPIASHPESIVSKKAVVEKGKDFGRDPIGTGPFVFQQWSSADEVTVVANDQYWRGRPAVAKITFVPIAEEEVAVAALERGEIQAMWTRGSAEAIQVLRANHDLTVAVAPRPGSNRYLVPNPAYAPFKDVRVRQALAYAINKQQIALAMGGTVSPLDQILPNLPWLADAAKAGKYPVYPYNPTLAKKLLADAGLTPLRVTLAFALRSPDPTLAQVIGEQLRRVGVDVTLDGQDPEAWNAHLVATQFQLTLLGLGRGSDPSEIARDLLSTSSFPPGTNSARYDRADGLIEAGARERDPQLRQQIYIALLKQVMGDLPYIPLANDTLVAAWRAPIRRMTTGIDNDFDALTIVTTTR